MSVGAVNKQTGDRIPTAGMPAIDNALDLTSVNPVQNAVITAALAGKQATLTFDDVPTDNSNNPVKSNGIYDALALKQNITDNNLTTTDKTTTGAINELKSGLTNLDSEVNSDATVYPYADVITIPDAIPANLAECNVKIEPVQDLHGYDHPWVGGAGKNKLPLVLADIKSANTTGTWSGNAYTVNDVTFTVNTDNDGNVTSINANGTASTADARLIVSNVGAANSSELICNGCPSSNFFIGITDNTAGYFTRYRDEGSSVTIPANFEIGFVYLCIPLGNTASNAVFYPMIRLSTETDATFAPYTNLCPISGHTEASVQRTGKNWFNVGTSTSDYTRNCVTGVNGNVLTVNIKANAETFAYRNQNINIKGNVAISYKASSADSRMFVRLRKADDSGWMDSSDATISGMSYNSYFGGWYKENSALSNNLSISIPNDCLYWQYGVGYGNTHTTTGANETVSDIQIELGSSASDYEPFKGKTYTIALGSTIYGGTVDFDSGVMTVTHKLIDMSDSSYTYSDQWGYSLFTSATFTDKALNHNFVCEAYKTVAVARDNLNNGEIGTYNTQSSRNIFAIRDDRFNNASDFRTAVTGYKIAYELATPTTVQLTPQQIQLLKGTNTLTASTGDISVTVNGVSGSIGQVQEQVNELAEDVSDHEERIETVESGLTTVNNKFSYVRFVDSYRHNAGYDTITITNLPSDSRIGILFTPKGIFPFRGTRNGIVVSDGIDLTVTNTGNEYTFTCAGEWYTVNMFMFTWDIGS